MPKLLVKGGTRDYSAECAQAEKCTKLPCLVGTKNVPICFQPKKEVGQ